MANLLPGALPAYARTATVCTGIFSQTEGCFSVDTSIIGGRAFGDYVVTRPGSLLFDIQARKAELATLSPDTSALFCAVNPAAATKANLPTVSFASAKLIINASVFPFEGRTRIDDAVHVAFTEIRTSDGLALPKFALNFARERGKSRVGLQFRPDLGPNVTEIPGLTSEWFFIDTTTGEASFPRLGGMPEPLRRLVYAIAYRLPSILSSATEIVVIPGPADPQWSMDEVAAIATKFSAMAFVTPQPLFDPIVSLACDLGPGYTTCDRLPELWRFRDYFARYGADYLGAGDPATRANLLANLRNWANANALSVFPGIQMGQPNQPDFRPKYEVQQLLVPMVTAWSLLRQDGAVTAAERTLIDQWIGRVVAYATEPFGGPQNDHSPFNVGYLTLGVRMAWGIITGSDAAIAEGVERIYMGLHQMRPDGSFPREVARGACALRYQNLQTLNLLYLAELAARQGYDAYALSVGGKTLHDAVRFVLDAVDDVNVISGYSAMNPTNCNRPAGSTMESSTTVQAVPDGFTISAWLEPYVARFPNHPNSARLRKLFPGGLAANRSIFHPLSGGNTTCFSAESRVTPITPIPGPTKVLVVEYYNASLDHYFVTPLVAEQANLDAGLTPTRWTRTGKAFNALPSASPGTSPVCRFYIPPSLGDSHFFGRGVVECDATAAKNPSFVLEAPAFMYMVPSSAGSCPSGTAPVYRVFSNRADANHRYMTDRATRDQMTGKGWLAEGDGPDLVVMCSPQ